MGLEDMIRRCEKNEKFLFISDSHYGVHDKKALKLVNNVAKSIKPTYIVFGGDMIDMYIASKFGKDFCKSTIQDEIDGFVKEIYKPLKKICPKANYIYLEGNHEHRLASRAMDAPAFQGLRVLDYGNLLKESCKENGVVCPAYDTELLVKQGNKPLFLFKHGNKANKYAANSELELEDISGMSGHIHRTDIRTKTNRTGTKIWTSVGHLSDISKLEYTRKNSNKSPNWNQGFGIVTKLDKLMTPNAINIGSDYTCYVDGKKYGL